MKTFYKSTTDYKTDNGTFTVIHHGTLAENLKSIESTLSKLNIVSANTYHKPIKKKKIDGDRVFLVDTYDVNCKTIDQQFFLGFPSVGIYESWSGHSAEQQYILDNHFDEKLEMYFGISRL